jgi:hypothetical protein
VAFCIAGAARSFAAPLVQESLRRHLIESYGARATLFLQLKASDSDKMSGRNHDHTTIRFRARSQPIEAILRALRSKWLAPLIGEAVVLNGSGSFAGASAGSGVVRRGNDSLWREYTSPCVSDSRHWLAQGTNEMRLLLDRLAQRWCLGAIRRYEEASGRRFDQVAFVRPDLLWAAPASPWCALDASKRVQTCFAPACDFAWLAPRRAMGSLLDQATAHRECGRGGRRTTNGRKASCCHTSEYLLWWAIRDASLPAVDRPALRPGRGFHALRYVDGVCETVLNTFYLSGSYVSRHELTGLPTPTGLAIRARFLAATPECAGNATLSTECVRAAVASCRVAMGLRPTARREGGARASSGTRL